MIIFLYGQDSYRISQKLQELITGYKAKNPSGLNFATLDFSESSVKDLEEKLINNSIIPEKKLIVLKNIEKAAEPLLEFLRSGNLGKDETTILIAVSFEDLNKNKLFEYLAKKPNQAQNFKLLKEYEVKNWAKKLLNSFGTDLTGEALDFLILQCGNDLWRLSGEIKKLADYKTGGVISRSQVEELVVAGSKYNIFELTDALAKKNKKRALLALYKALENGEKPTELLGMLAWQIRNIFNFKSDPKSLNLHPFVLGKIKESAGFFSMDELKAILLKIIDLDLAFKTTDVNEKTALSLLISEL